MIDDLIATARQLVVNNARGANQAALKRAVSTAYYALFHALAQSNADILTGSSISDPNWVRVYRAMDHASAKRVLVALSANSKAHPALTVAQAFLELQETRHEADYNPACSFGVIDAATLVLQASDAISSFRSLPKAVRLDLATRILFKTRP